MSTAAGRVVLTFDVDDKGVVQGLGRVGKTVDDNAKGMTTRMVATGAAIGTALGKLAVDGLKMLGREFVEIATRGVELAPVVTSFDKLTTAIGESGDEMLSVARSSTKGLITDLDLMSSANKAIQLGLPVTSKSFGELAQMATVLGRAMRQDAKKSVDDLIVALGRQSPMILDNLGLTVKVGEANQTYAKSIGKSADQLTDAEKKLAFYNAALEAGRVAADRLGGIQLTLADRITIAKNWMTNFTDALGVAVATSPVINSAFDSIGEALGSAMGENQTQRVQMLTEWVNKLAIGGVSAAQLLVSGAGIIVRAWEGLKMIFAGVMIVVAGVAEGIIKSFATIVDAANRMPGVRGQFDGLSASLNDLAHFSEGVRQSFVDQAAEAWEGVKGNGALGQTLTAVGARLDDMKAKMQAAARTQADTAEIARQLVGAQDEQAQTATAAASAAKKLQQEVDKQRQALSQLGITTARDVNTQIFEFQQMLARAAAEGVPLQRVIGLITPKLLDLRAKAMASGTAVDGLNSFLRGLQAVSVELNGGLPRLSTTIGRLGDDTGVLAARFGVVTGEMLAARTESKLITDAFAYFGQQTRAELDRTATEARLHFDRMRASGQATPEALKEAWEQLLEAERRGRKESIPIWKAWADQVVAIGKSTLRSLTDQIVGINSRLNDEKKRAADDARDHHAKTAQDAAESVARSQESARQQYDRTLEHARGTFDRELDALDEAYRGKLERAEGSHEAIKELEIWYARERQRIDEEKNAALVAADQAMNDAIAAAAEAANGKVAESHAAMQEAVEQASHPWRDRMLEIWQGLKAGVKDVLSQMLSDFVTSFLGGMLEGLNSWARQAGSIIGGILGMGSKVGSMSLPGGVIGPGALTAPGAGAGAGGAGLGAGLATAGLGALAVGAAAAQGWMATEWAKAAFGPHYSDQASQDAERRAEAIRMAEYTGAAARAGMSPEEFIASGGVPGFVGGGWGEFGAGTPAVLHGREAIFPLPDDFDLADTLRSLDQSRRTEGSRRGVINNHISIDGRLLARVMTDYQVDEWRLAGVTT